MLSFTLNLSSDSSLKNIPIALCLKTMWSEGSDSGLQSLYKQIFSTTSPVLSFSCVHDSSVSVCNHRSPFPRILRSLHLSGKLPGPGLGLVTVSGFKAWALFEVAWAYVPVLLLWSSATLDKFFILSKSVLSVIKCE